MASSPSYKPVHRFQQGRVTATIWLNESVQGPFHTFTLTQSFRDGTNGNLRRGHSFRLSDAPDLLTVIQLAHEWMATPPPAA